MRLSFLKQMAKALSVQFGKDCEIVIHDLTRKSLGRSIEYVENGHVTDRKPGDGPSQIVLETLKKDPSKIQDRLGYLTRTANGKTLKSSTVFVRDDAGEKDQYIFSINHDIRKLLYLQDSIHALVSGETQEGPSGRQQAEPGKIHTNVADILDDLIAQSVALVGKPASLMTKDEKVEAIQFLNNSGAFLITRSGDKVSQYFGISKYTLYSYIKSE